ncbi:MAG: HAD family phosphatase [Hyphomonadaceae bacterium]|nr:HAD family phosphatase [Hyphomonadaceae bacterium]
MSLPRPPRAVVFDLDGTLIDSEALVRDAYFAACANFGIAMSDAQFLELVGMHRDANNVSLRKFYGDDFPVDDFREAARGHIGDRAAPLKPGALELMDALRRMAAPIGLATSSYRPWVERHFTAHQLHPRFAAIVSREDVVNGKPDPEPYVRASYALGANTKDVLVLEDSHAGVRSAHDAGCMVVMIPDLLQPDEEMRAKARLAASLHDVVALLTRT